MGREEHIARILGLALYLALCSFGRSIRKEEICLETKCGWDDHIRINSSWRRSVFPKIIRFLRDCCVTS